MVLFRIGELGYAKQIDRFQCNIALRGDGIEYGYEIADALETIARQIRVGAARGLLVTDDGVPIGRWGFGIQRYRRVDPLYPAPEGAEGGSSEEGLSPDGDASARRIASGSSAGRQRTPRQ